MTESSVSRVSLFGNGLYSSRPQTRHFQHLVDEKKKWVIIDSEMSLDLEPGESR